MPESPLAAIKAAGFLSAYLGVAVARVHPLIYRGRIERLSWTNARLKPRNSALTICSDHDLLLSLPLSLPRLSALFLLFLPPGWIPLALIYRPIRPAVSLASSLLSFFFFFSSSDGYAFVPV